MGGGCLRVRACLFCSPPHAPSRVQCVCVRGAEGGRERWCAWACVKREHSRGLPPCFFLVPQSLNPQPSLFLPLVTFSFFFFYTGDSAPRFEKTRERERGRERESERERVSVFVVSSPRSSPSVSLPGVSLPSSSSLSTHQLDHADVGPPGLAVHGHGRHALDPVLDGVGDVGDDLERKRFWGEDKGGRGEV